MARHQPPVVTLDGRPAAPDALRVVHAFDIGNGPRLLAFGPGGLWSFVRNRRQRFLCPAGVAHRRYWRAVSRGGSARSRCGLACLHTTRLELDALALTMIDEPTVLALHVEP